MAECKGYQEEQTIDLLNALLADLPPRTHADREADYHVVWMAHAGGHRDLLAMALAGGALADRLAWVFAAGYQAACRHAFPGAVEVSGWVAFVASEDRSDSNPLPGVVLRGDALSGLLGGWKTWVAGAESVAALIVKVGTGGNALYYLIARETPGLTVESGPRASFLAELTQGKAAFEGVQIQAAMRLDAARAALFHLVEPLYIYAAFCAFVQGSTREHDLISCSRDCLDGIVPALASLDGSLDRQNVLKADARAQDLLVRLSGNRLAAAGDWASDQRLIAMYSKGLRRAYGDL